MFSTVSGLVFTVSVHYTVSLITTAMWYNYIKINNIDFSPQNPLRKAIRNNDHQEVARLIDEEKIDPSTPFVVSTSKINR